MDPQRRPIPGAYTTAAECRRALNIAIVEIDKGLRAAAPATARGPVRRMSTLIEDYIQDRRDDPRDPLATRTVRDYREILRNVITHPRADLGRIRVTHIDSPALDRWLADLANAGLSHVRIAKSFALVRAALAWEVRKGRLGVNPAREVRRASTKKGRAQRAKADPVLLPSWRELADLVAYPERAEDRLLILVMAWTGLRWSEAISLSVHDLWPDRPRLSISRVLVWDQEHQAWQVEDVKAGNADTVPLPAPLWEALKVLASTRNIERRIGGDLLFRPTRRHVNGKPCVTIDHTDWSKRVWRPARAAAGLAGNPHLSVLDPRRRAIHIKDLRAFAASVIVDSGGTIYEAAALLRHADIVTTNKYYARAQDERSHDPARARLRLDPGLSLHQRIDALWATWTAAFAPEIAAGSEQGGW